VAATKKHHSGRANNQQAQVCPILAPSADLRSAEQNLVVFLRHNLHGMCVLRDDMSERHGSPDLPAIGRRRSFTRLAFWSQPRPLPAAIDRKPAKLTAMSLLAG
jgi:hypothetical protein